MTQALAPKLRVIGRYSILKELRRERHSVSYAAVDPVMNRQLVVKAVELLPSGPRLTTDERRRVEQAFVRQAQAAGRLHHPHIVTVFDAGLSHAFGFLVIERVNGMLLADLLARGLRPDFVHCASIVARIADAITCAHANGVAHGHLGPQHVHLLPDGSPKVSGFGGWIDDGASGDEALAGTARLLPYFQNEITEETRRQDVLAVAGLLFMLLTGRSPAPGEAAAALAQGQSPTLQARRETPRALARLLDGWLAPAANAEPVTAATIRDALTNYLWDARTEGEPATSLGIPLAPPPERAVHTTTIAPTNPAAAIPAPEGATAIPRSNPGTGPQDNPHTHPRTNPRTNPRAVPPGHGEPAPPPNTMSEAIPAARAAGEPQAPADDWLGMLHDLVERGRPWLQRNRLALSGSGAMLLVALVIGVLLANLHRAPAAAAGVSDPSLVTPEAAAGSAAPVASHGPVRFRIRPWGEILVDGKYTGVSPPMAEVELPNGYHRIEVRHTDYGSWQTEIELKNGAPIVVEHDFP